MPNQVYNCTVWLIKHCIKYTVHFFALILLQYSGDIIDIYHLTNFYNTTPPVNNEAAKPLEIILGSELRSTHMHAHTHAYTSQDEDNWKMMCRA